jgi:hypothetical protein
VAFSAGIITNGTFCGTASGHGPFGTDEQEVKNKRDNKNSPENFN